MASAERVGLLCVLATVAGASALMFGGSPVPLEPRCRAVDRPELDIDPADSELRRVVGTKHIVVEENDGAVAEAVGVMAFLGLIVLWLECQAEIHGVSRLTLVLSSVGV